MLSSIRLPLLAAVLCASSLTPPPAEAEPPTAAVSAYLRDLLPDLDDPVPVLVHGATLADARAAVGAAGLTPVVTLERIDTVGVVAGRAEIEAVRRQPGVTYVEAQPQQEALDATSNIATRGVEAGRTRSGADGTALTGRGVSIAMVDEGIDPTHPAFQDPSGSAVVANLKVACRRLDTSTYPASDPDACTVRREPSTLNLDTLGIGGHGTATASVAAGRPVRLASGAVVRGAAPGADLVALSNGVVLTLLSANAALEWVLEHHQAPCGAEVPAAQCPPIKVVSNSYGPGDQNGYGSELDERSATVQLQRALVADGVVVVWANGNSGGDGTASTANPFGTDPTPGVISAGWYDDLETGSRNGLVAAGSSRGRRGDQSSYPDVMAPAQNITAACRPYQVICSTGLRPESGPGPLDIADWNTLSGSSFAAPTVAGVVAQLFQAVPDATPAQIERALETTAHRFTDGAPYEPGRWGPTSYDKGHGLVDVVRAVDWLTAATARTPASASSISDR